MSIAAQFGFAVAGGVCGAVLTQAATFLRDWLNKAEDGRFTALTLALALEDYATRCSEPIFALSTYVDTNYGTPEPSGAVPGLPEFAEKTNWRSIGVQHASAVLGFRVRVDSVNGALHDTWFHEGKVSAWGEAADSAVELGASALEIADRLRLAFKLPAAQSHDGHFNPRKFFSQRLAQLQNRRAANRKANELRTP